MTSIEPTSPTVPATATNPDPTAEPAPPRWLRAVALVTGVLAAVAGFLTVRSANLSNEAIYHSNQGVLFQARASDAWAQYQAESIKARIVETAQLAGNPDPAARERLAAQSEDLRGRQPKAKAEAQELEHQRDTELKDTAKHLAEKDTLTYAGVAIQLAIALASVAALTRRRPAFIAAVAAGTAGIVVAGFAMIVHHR